MSGLPPGLQLASLGVAALVIVVVAVWGACSRTGRIVHDFSPVAIVIGLFELAGPVIAAANPARWDATFRALDARWYGDLPDAWHDALGRPGWLTDLASMAYVSFYFVPIFIGVGLYRRPSRGEFDAYVLAVVSTFVASWIGYLAFPTLGPRVDPSMGSQWLGGGWLSQSISVALHALEHNVLDAFPSGHAAVSLVYVTYGWRAFPRWRLPLVILEMVLLFSTVYLSLHYVVDVFAGALLGIAMMGFLRLRTGSPMRGRNAPAGAPRAHQGA
jgi:membrane-associated phospholipid phosphatase